MAQAGRFAPVPDRSASDEQGPAGRPWSGATWPGSIAGWKLDITTSNAAPSATNQTVDVHKGEAKAITLGGTDPDYLSSLANRLARLDKQCGEEERENIVYSITVLFPSEAFQVDVERKLERALNEKLGSPATSDGRSAPLGARANKWRTS